MFISDMMPLFGLTGMEEEQKTADFYFKQTNKIGYKIGQDS